MWRSTMLLLVFGCSNASERPAIPDGAPCETTSDCGRDQQCRAAECVPYYEAAEYAQSPAEVTPSAAAEALCADVEARPCVAYDAEECLATQGALAPQSRPPGTCANLQTEALECVRANLLTCAEYAERSGETPAGIPMHFLTIHALQPCNMQWNAYQFCLGDLCGVRVGLCTQARTVGGPAECFPTASDACVGQSEATCSPTAEDEAVLSCTCDEDTPRAGRTFLVEATECCDAGLVLPDACGWGPKATDGPSDIEPGSPSSRGGADASSGGHGSGGQASFDASGF